MWDLIVSVPDHCLSFYFKYLKYRYLYLKIKDISFITQIHISIFKVEISLILIKIILFINMLRNFKNATFYVDCFFYCVDLMLFPIHYFILLRDKQ